MVQTRTIQNSNFEFYAGSTADGLTAVATGTQAAALALDASVNRITTAVAGASVSLPAVVGQAGAWNLRGAPVYVINATANDIICFPANGSGDTINGAASTVGLVIGAGSVAQFIGATGYPSSKTGGWYANLSTAGSGPLDAPLSIIIASGSNSQSGAAAVVPGNVIVGTVSATTRAIRLSAGGTNKNYIVFNDTATAVKVYPVTNGTISSSATNVAVQIRAHLGEIFLYRNGLHVVIMGATGV